MVKKQNWFKILSFLFLNKLIEKTEAKKKKNSDDFASLKTNKL